MSRHRGEQEATVRDSGFTLLELVVALAIAAIVAAFALPAYRGQIARGHRTDAITALYRAAQFADTAAPDANTLPAGLDQSPSSGVAVYRLSLSQGDETNGGYVIEARPTEPGPMRDDACGTFRLDATGTRTNVPPGDASAPTLGECWRDR
ncbi:type IV pilus assembly protein PilE [Paraburkholderia caballeronis]|uniref:type IV pilin protein n=1 Tax=Paraburkholderia caballeronis TaxID=416943 RepID=UPI0010663F0C|nr:type IV pilin protein [Paraburkholderia caballeronis]TDV35216.1 type IV pilus assembly protein PilE [Paraburkholderia caballeronis]